MSDDTCTFSYVSAKDSAPKTATGVERTWLDLKIEFSRQGNGLPGARYYKKVGEQGPELFAVKHDQTVWYHDKDKWTQYKTATDIKYGTRHPAKNDNEKNDDEESLVGEEEGGE